MILRWLRSCIVPPSDPLIDQLIVPPRPRYTDHDDALRLRTEQRRAAANRIRARAKHVETGAPVSDVLRMVK